MRDLADRNDVRVLVEAFYTSAFADPLIGPVFTDVAHLDLDAHLPVICDFWETVLFTAGSYRRNILQVHVALHAQHRLGPEHFDRWLAVWARTVDGHFHGPAADRAKLQAQRIAGSMQRRLAGRSGSDFETIGRREPAASR